MPAAARGPPLVSGRDGRDALALALEVRDAIEEHREERVVSARIGILGGSGLYDLAAPANAREEKTRDAVRRTVGLRTIVGELAGRPVAFLARHGRGHRFSPSEINYRANIFGFKLLGCDAILSVAAVGSLREEMPPSHVCIPAQFIDRTRSRADTFFGRRRRRSRFARAIPSARRFRRAGGVAPGEPGPPSPRAGPTSAWRGPQFSTRAESELYRSWGASVIGMTNLTEAKLAREAELCYSRRWRW